MSAKLNDVIRTPGLPTLLARIADTPIRKLEQLLPFELAAERLKPPNAQRWAITSAGTCFGDYFHLNPAGAVVE